MNSRRHPEPLRIVVEQSDTDESDREFHVNFELTSLACQHLWRNEVTNLELSPLAEALLEIPGVAGVIARPYSVHVIESRAMDWSEITGATEELRIWIGKTFAVGATGNWLEGHTGNHRRTGRCQNTSWRQR